ncbi:MAG: hypothetical protein HY906_20565 [Deltaproteobacteria bacterium]|nr:hypothetical protein [Deltaproteobacteria bacterium]
MTARPVTAVVVTLLGVASAPPAYAYDAATTHAGLTARAALASSLHRVLATQLGVPRGLFEPLRIAPEFLPGVDARAVRRHLQALDPGQGYRPDVGLVAPALSWLEAGSVIEQMPAERGRHHFLEPRSGRGLDNRVPGLSLRARVLSALEQGGTFGGIFVGTNFDLSGHSSLAWLEDADNDYSLARFLDARERAAVAELPAERATSLAYALLCAGAILHLLEDAGEPAHVRNDYRVAFGARVGTEAVDRGSRLEHHTARTYGFAAIPEPGPPVRRARLRDYFVAPDGQGLAQRTQRRFFSPGTLPRPVQAIGLRPAAIVKAVNATLPFAEPRIKALDLGAASRGGAYLGTTAVPQLVAYRVDSRGLLSFWLDDRTDLAYARTLLPEVGSYAAGLLDHLFRGRLGFAPAAAAEARHGGRLTAVLSNRGPALAAGQLTVLAEDSRGRRRVIDARQAPAAPAGARMARIDAPRGAVRLVAVFRGLDAAGDPVTVVEEAPLPLR